ncbi:MAG TPA: SMR family transporter [Novosphingobium sp.]
MLTTMSLRPILMIGLVVLTQVAGASMLPRTAAFRDLPWTFACLATYAVSLYALARTLNEGMNLSLAMPVLAALVPLLSILVAVTLLGEQLSWPRMGLLGTACLMIGLAARV